MNIDLSGKRALITGSSAGIGFGIAEAFLNAGASVVLNARNEERLLSAKQRLEQAHPEAQIDAVVADVGNAKDMARLCDHAESVDILVHNAAIFEPKPFGDITDEEWELFFCVNVLSGVRLARALMPSMMDKGWGRVIFISSESGLNMPPEMLHYGVTKASVNALSRGLAETAVGKNVTVNSICPGPTKSDGIVGYLQGLAEQTGQTVEQVQEAFIKEHRSTSIIQRFSEVEEVANMVTYIASPQASSTTGATLRVDGGIIRSIA